MSSTDLTEVSSMAVTAGMLWLAKQAPRPDAVQAKWSSGSTAAVPVGTAFALVRVTDEHLGRAAFHVLSTQAPQRLGPVIVDQRLTLVEFLANVRPPVWQSAGTMLLDGSQEPLRDVQCPPADREAAGRRWLNPPRAAPGCAPGLTDPLDLGRALTAARLQLIQAGHPFTT
ncbi:hypothetical protein ACFV4P_02785 [Kitasatospora sp. NPDC059795]|uniref:hypothetical protein n=1 Tax=Kitasatospora sp. NPDC059795 TaxID=3346949 RepID=UPI003654B309